MICYPNAKVNIGLNVLRKRTDKYHDLETVFYPIQLCDILEINRSDKFCFAQSGISIDAKAEDNLIVRAFRLLQNDYQLSNIDIHLHKQIPFGAGLGGGSSDAAFTIMTINQLFNLNLNEELLLYYARKLGSDCPFFILNRPVFAEGRGDQFTELKLCLEDYFLVLVKPNSWVTTAEAYGHVITQIPKLSLQSEVKKHVIEWKNGIFNRFEQSVFPFHPEIALIKETLYKHGAIYASMSGSGSSVFGLFKNVPDQFSENFPGCFFWEEKCKY